MKKSIVVFSGIIVLLVLSGCTKVQANKNYILATGGTSGTYYPYGGAMANIWNTKIDKMNVT
ncbi:MAG TPA: TAXI family TRAP transporter solute-binding subunit, partial [Treponemataceae bacterium]|nr:TAXI family TRAP transporter solute-binding subunit [Treponemataceae bacterium]